MNVEERYTRQECILDLQKLSDAYQAACADQWQQYQKRTTALEEQYIRDRKVIIDRMLLID